MKQNPLYGQDIVSIDQLDKTVVATVMQRAHLMQKLVETKGGNNLLSGRVMTAIFYEPSSRTFGSFVAAMQRLGGTVIPLLGMSTSSVAKGETLSDTICTFSSYTDVIVLRHPDNGSARLAAEFSERPVLNAGDGTGEHPTQALLDLYTIDNHFGSPNKLTVTMVGDLINGRTTHSLSKLLAFYKQVTINLVSPKQLRLPKDLRIKLEKSGLTIAEHETLESVLPTTDVLYVTRVQKERFADLTVYEKLKHKYIVTPSVMKQLKPSAILMHPLPRVGEITPECDLDNRSVYMSEQMRGGLYVRMALLSLILKP